MANPDTSTKASGKKTIAPTAAVTAPTFPITFSVPGSIAAKGVYAAIFGNSGSGTGPQVYLASVNGSDGNSIVATATLSSAVTLPASSITTGSSGNFPKKGSLLLTQTDQYNNITAQASVTYTGYDTSTGTFSGVSGGTGSFAKGTQVTLSMGWTLSSTLTAGTTAPLLNLFGNSGSFAPTSSFDVVINLPNPGLSGNSIFSGEIVLFVGANSGLVVNAAQELVVPTLGSNPYDTFALFEWGLSGALTPGTGGFLDYDVSAIDQVGFPFQVSAQMSNAPAASSAPPAPFNNGVGFLQSRKKLFSGFSEYLAQLPSASNPNVFLTLAPEYSLFAERITAPQDYLNFVVNNGPAFAQVPAGISGFNPIQLVQSSSSTFTFSVNPGSIVIQTAGTGYTTAPTLTFSAPPSGTTATATATIANGSVNSVTVTNTGSGYTSSPAITVSAPPGSGTAAAVAAGLMGQTLNYAITALRIQTTITNGGSGYTSAPVVMFSAPAKGAPAKGIALLSPGGTVTGIHIIHPGYGYTAAPTVTFSEGGGSGATATAVLVESMAGLPQQVTVNQGFAALLNWMPYPNASAYNIYRSSNADMSGAMLINSTPVSPAGLDSDTTLTQGANSSSTSVTISTTPPATLPGTGTLLISQGGNQSLFQYTSVSGSTFSGQMYGNASFAEGATVILLPFFTDNGATGTSATPPASNYNYEPLNQYFTAALHDFFEYYKTNTFEIDLAGEVATKWTGKTQSITANGNTYTALVLTGEQGVYGNNYAGLTANIYLPFFSSNIDPAAVPSMSTLPPPPSWLINPSESGSSMVFGADGVFDMPDNTGVAKPASPLSTAPTAIVKDIMNPINAAINRGLTPRKVNGAWTNIIPPMYWSQAPLFPLTATISQTGGFLTQNNYYYAITGVNVNGDTSNKETVPGNIVTVPFSSLSPANTNTVTLTIPNTGQTTFSQFNIYRGNTPDTLLNIGSVTAGITTFTDNGHTTGGTIQPPSALMNAPGQLVNWYAAYLHQPDVSINGLAYGTPYDDQGGFSTNVNLPYTTQVPQGLTISFLPWTN